MIITLYNYFIRQDQLSNNVTPGTACLMRWSRAEEGRCLKLLLRYGPWSTTARLKVHFSHCWCKLTSLLYLILPIAGCAIRLSTEVGSSRGLAVTKQHSTADVIISLPWRFALTPEAAGQYLENDRKRQKGDLTSFPTLCMLANTWQKSSSHQCISALAFARAESSEKLHSSQVDLFSLHVAGNKRVNKSHSSLNTGLLPDPVSGLLDALEKHEIAEVSQGSGWVLLLVLHLIRELRNPKSAWLPYIQMLPAPPGSLVKAVCCEGPDATDLTLFRQWPAKLDILHSA